MNASQQSLTAIQRRLLEAERLVAIGALREAYDLCAAVLREAPGASHAYFLLGVIFAEHKSNARAIEFLSRAAALAPGAARYQAILAQCLANEGRAREAREAAQRAADLDPVDAETLDRVGAVFTQTGDHDRALEMTEKAVALAPSSGAFRYNLASTLRFLGRFEDAEEAFLRAVELDKSLARAWLALVQLRKQTPERNHGAAIESYLKNPLNAEQRLLAAHALAKTKEDMDAYADAVSVLSPAKAAKRAAMAYDVADERRYFDAAKRGIEAPPPRGARPADMPIFVIGLPRTGTTLLERTLGAHPDLLAAGELSEFARACARAFQTRTERSKEVEHILQATDLDEGKAGDLYLAAVESRIGRRTHFIDKMPTNFLFAGRIHRALPNARIICMRRNPLDCCAAIYFNSFAADDSFYRYAYSLEETARYYLLFDDLIAHWRKNLPADRFTEIGYESLVTNQEAETRRLLAFSGLEWDERCLSFHESAGAVTTASAVQVRQPLYQSSLGRWKRYGAAMRPALDVLRLHMEALGLDASLD